MWGCQSPLWDFARAQWWKIVVVFATGALLVVAWFFDFDEAFLSFAVAAFTYGLYRVSRNQLEMSQRQQRILKGQYEMQRQLHDADFNPALRVSTDSNGLISHITDEKGRYWSIEGNLYLWNIGMGTLLVESFATDPSETTDMQVKEGNSPIHLPFELKGQEVKHIHVRIVTSPRKGKPKLVLLVRYSTAAKQGQASEFVLLDWEAEEAFWA